MNRMSSRTGRLRTLATAGAAAALVAVLVPAMASATPPSGAARGPGATSAASDVHPATLVRNTGCPIQGSLVIDYDSSVNPTVCWTGSGRSDNSPDDLDYVAVQVHTGNNSGALTVAEPNQPVHDLPFGAQQTLNLAAGTHIRVLTMNT